MLTGEGLFGKGAAYCEKHLETWFNPVALLKAAQEQVPAAVTSPNPDRWLNYDPDFVYRYAQVPGITVAELLALSDATLSAMTTMDGVPT